MVIKFILFISCIVFFNCSLFSQNSKSKINQIRHVYKNAGQDEDKNEELIKLSKSCENTIIKGYYASGLAIKAKYLYNPFSKLDYFKRGTTLLDKTIAKDKMNIELRFMRFCIQTVSPNFLGYNEEIQNDIELIVKNFTTIDPDMMPLVGEYLLQDIHCEEKHKVAIRKYLKK
jgi:hypothetical protein